MVTRLDWWVGVVLVVLAILAHALVPRYEYQQTAASGIAWIRVDLWTGQAQLVAVTADGVRITRRWLEDAP